MNKLKTLTVIAVLSFYSAYLKAESVNFYNTFDEAVADERVNGIFSLYHTMADAKMGKVEQTPKSIIQYLMEHSVYKIKRVHDSFIEEKHGKLLTITPYIVQSEDGKIALRMLMAVLDKESLELNKINTHK